MIDLVVWWLVGIFVYQDGPGIRRDYVQGYMSQEECEIVLKGLDRTKFTCEPIRTLRLKGKIVRPGEEI
jgi:hypothetical protein